MPGAIVRTTWKENLTVATGETTSSAAEIWDASFGMLYIPAEFNGTTITFTVCDTIDGTYLGVKEENGSDTSLTVAASTAVAIPSEVFAAPYLKIVCGSAQTTTPTVFRLSLKG
jgi:hypothetical protein